MPSAHLAILHGARLALCHVDATASMARAHVHAIA
jgi:hypothetical protein